MKIDEGYIKYNSVWSNENITMPKNIFVQLNRVRTDLLKLNMIGKIPKGPGFGNISVRAAEDSFYITATDTGHIQELKQSDMAEVYKTDILKNTVWCKGLKNGSSESLSHAIIYNELPDANSVIHIHHKPMWQAMLRTHPSTDSNILYGTPEMANSIKKLIAKNRSSNIIVLGGHEDGIIVFGHSLSEVQNIILKEFEKNK